MPRHPKTSVWKKSENSPTVHNPIRAGEFANELRKKNEESKPIAQTTNGLVEIEGEIKYVFLGTIAKRKKLTTLRALRHSIYDFCASQGMTQMAKGEMNRSHFSKMLREYSAVYADEMHKQLQFYWRQDAERGAQRKSLLELNAKKNKPL